MLTAALESVTWHLGQAPGKGRGITASQNTEVVVLLRGGASIIIHSYAEVLCPGARIPPVNVKAFELARYFPIHIAAIEGCK